MRFLKQNKHSTSAVSASRSVRTDPIISLALVNPSNSLPLIEVKLSESLAPYSFESKSGAFVICNEGSGKMKLWNKYKLVLIIWLWEDALDCSKLFADR